jgi:hypothetical protein
MKLITDSLTQKLLANGRAQRAATDNDQPGLDFKPVVKLFTPDAQCTWLLTELDPDGWENRHLTDPSAADFLGRRP